MATNDRIIQVTWTNENKGLPRRVLVPGFIPDGGVVTYLMEIYNTSVKSWEEV